MRIVSIGEILWDVVGDAEYLGGAPFNFAAHAQRLGHEVLFLSAVGDDERGRLALARIEELRLSTKFVQKVGAQPTGLVTVRLDPAGQPDFLIHRPAAYDCLELDQRSFEQIAEFQPGWIYFGTLHQMNPQARSLTRRLIESNPRARRFYDINLRAGSYTPTLVCELLKDAHVAKMNDAEAAEVARFLGSGPGAIEEFCRRCAKQFGGEAVCITRGERGCALLIGDTWAEVPGCHVRAADTIGAGDAFAAAFLHGLVEGWTPAAIGEFANRVGALVASRPGAIPPWTLEECSPPRRTRPNGV